MKTMKDIEEQVINEVNNAISKQFPNLKETIIASGSSELETLINNINISKEKDIDIEQINKTKRILKSFMEA